VRAHLFPKPQVSPDSVSASTTTLTAPSRPIMNSQSAQAAPAKLL
jgi:hypothetical protein